VVPMFTKLVLNYYDGLTVWVPITI
jgi:hypothetical protein